MNRSCEIVEGPRRARNEARARESEICEEISQNKLPLDFPRMCAAPCQPRQHCQTDLMKKTAPAGRLGQFQDDDDDGDDDDDP